MLGALIGTQLMSSRVWVGGMRLGWWQGKLPLGSCLPQLRTSTASLVVAALWAGGLGPQLRLMRVTALLIGGFALPLHPLQAARIFSTALSEGFPDSQVAVSSLARLPTF